MHEGATVPVQLAVPRLREALFPVLGGWNIKPGPINTLSQPKPQDVLFLSFFWNCLFPGEWSTFWKTPAVPATLAVAAPTDLSCEKAGSEHRHSELKNYHCFFFLVNFVLQTCISSGLSTGADSGAGGGGNKNHVQAFHSFIFCGMFKSPGLTLVC